MVIRMLHLPPDKNRLHNEHSAQSVKDHTTEYETDNRSEYDILDYISKDTDLYQHVKKHMSKRDNRGAFYAIHSSWLGWNHVNPTASEAELGFQMSTCNRKKETWNWEKYVAQYIQCYIILGNLIEYGYQDLDPELKDLYLLNGIRNEMLYTAVATVRTHQTNMQWISMQLLPSSSILTKEQHQVWRLSLLPRTDLIRGRRLVLVVALLKERLRWRKNLERSMTQC